MVVKNLREKLKVAEERLSAIMNENHKLKVRAAVAWEELTPRPNYEHTYKALNLNQKDFVGKSSKHILLELTKHFSKSFIGSSSNKWIDAVKKVSFSRGRDANTSIIIRSAASSRKNTLERSNENVERSKSKKSMNVIPEKRQNKKRTTEKFPNNLRILITENDKNVCKSDTKLE